MAGVTVTNAGLDAIVFSASSDGVLGWTQTRRGDDPTADQSFNAAAVDAQGNVVAAGFQTLDLQTAWVEKFSPDGELLWARTLDEAGVQSRWDAVSINPSGVIALAGTRGTPAASGREFVVATLTP